MCSHCFDLSLWVLSFLLLVLPTFTLKKRIFLPRTSPLPEILSKDGIGCVIQSLPTSVNGFLKTFLREVGIWS